MKTIDRIGFRIVTLYEIEDCDVPDHVYGSFKKLEELGVREISNFSDDYDECNVYDHIMRLHSDPSDSITCEINLDEINIDETDN